MFPLRCCASFTQACLLYAAVLMVRATPKRIDRVAYGGELETYLVNLTTSVRIGYSL